MHKFQMNVFTVVALGVGAMVGAGIFALLGQVVLKASSMTYVAFMVSGVAAMFCGYAYAGLAGYLPQSGGITAYYHAAYPSKKISGLLSCVYLFTLMVSIAMLSKSFAIYALGIFDILNPNGLQINLIALILVASLTLLNVQNSGKVGKTELLLVSVKLLILIVFVIAVLFRPEFAAPEKLENPKIIDFLGSIGITFFAYAGFGMMVNAAKDVPNPRKTLPMAIYAAIGIVILLYLSLAYVVMNFIPPEQLMESADTAVAVVAKKIFGNVGSYILSGAALIAFISGINAMFFSCYKIITALVSLEILPSGFNKVVYKNGTTGYLLASLLIFAAIVYFDFNMVVNISSAAFLLSYLAVMLAAWKLRKETQSRPLALIVGAGLLLFILISFFISIIE